MSLQWETYNGSKSLNQQMLKETHQYGLSNLAMNLKKR